MVGPSCGAAVLLGFQRFFIDLVAMSASKNKQDSHDQLTVEKIKSVTAGQGEQWATVQAP
ncbi:hypothetical protein [Mesorhizobium amorphae]|uniref:Uncharacterized protein n=1 Tax=Mesorhizobium amorphae CCNWGS0123 TaxID=1082933 RepID=G6YIZ4_9HYPH|nr:hypothetical protein [Mesorhizobium amorphae]ANT54244.1 hypothetical protein A6B35_29755 [Mesorhizobium amorphae CCNWGS0123]EHH05498.1 hypothetical protein MEA186_29847 [Mesorhizobium amorphae CCNWGS0123]